MVVNGQEQGRERPHVVIVGGGIAGLAAAFFLRDEPVRVTVLEGASRLGGKLAVSEVEGVAVDAGADMVWRPKTAGLIAAAGLGDQITLAGTTSAAIWTRGKMRPLPEGQFMGVPSDMDQLAASGLLSPEGAARAREDLEMPSTVRDGDVAVGAHVARRLGQEVADRITDPFLYEMCAGRAEDLSYEATLTLLATTSDKYQSLAEAAGSLIATPHPKKTGIATITGGLGRLPDALAKAVVAASPGASVRTRAAVRELARTEDGWRLGVESAAGTEHIAADAVILAVPAGPASRLLAGATGATQATAELAGIPYAGVVDITLAYPRRAFPGGLAERGICGYRVPAVDGRVVKSVTFSTVKWPQAAAEVEIVRCRAGRMGEEDLLQRDDADLAGLAASELAEATGVVGDPVSTRVTRWDDSMPQYLVGHGDRVARIRTAVAAQPGLALCGAAYDGVGVGHCMATARKATHQVLTSLGTAGSAAVKG
ncbi:protoporphyrinogen oxidase [Actinomadura sp. WMMA1423]|uniref:protoporphyrinogen oxidase n=1 Tax=Actinomadura sp. WMMA1423 TaxID=2591108 RepID=UPI001147539A|nr:protoporphyrinogen oxidase [Actinomadura sp. WMMA1423]